MKYFLFVKIVIILMGCSHQKPTEADIVGTWESENGLTSITFNNDRTCSGTLEPGSPLLINNNAGYIHFDSIRWEYEERSTGMNKPCVSVTYKQIGFTLYIQGSNLFRDKPPWQLFNYVGDPDEMNLYILHKK